MTGVQTCALPISGRLAGCHQGLCLPDHDLVMLGVDFQQHIALFHPLVILDEPTSGVDPAARDGFWRLLIELSRDQGVTIFLSTHFMNEAQRCDRISLMHAGKVLACDTPAALQQQFKGDTLEAAFVTCLEQAHP